MTKLFCDLCGAEMPNGIGVNLPDQINRRKEACPIRIVVESQSPSSSHWNHRDICAGCIRHAAIHLQFPEKGTAP